MSSLKSIQNIPCFNCIANKLVSPYFCRPPHCHWLDQWLKIYIQKHDNTNEDNNMSHLSFEGQTKESYCYECLSKHIQTAKVLLREALQRAESDAVNSEGVIEKIRGVVEELSGFEDDSLSVSNEQIIGLNAKARDIRKAIYACKAEIGGASVEDLREIKRRVDLLVDEVYFVRQQVECPTCKVVKPGKKEEKAEEVVPNMMFSASEKRREFLEKVRQR